MLLLQCAVVSTLLYVHATVRPDLDTLRFVHVLWRHGARTPGGKSQMEDKDQLTSEGARQQYELGQWLRRRYDGFLSKQYKPHEIYVRSSDFDRTLMSAEWNMAGLYPVNVSVIEGLPWQAIPVHTMQTQHDRVLFGEEKTPCPAEVEYRNALSSSEKYREIVNGFENLLGVTSLHNVKVTDFMPNLQAVVEPYMLQEQPGVTPSWMSEDGMKTYAYWMLQFIELIYDNDVVKRLRGGPLMLDILNRFEQVNASQENRLKFYAYSGHDFSIQSLLSIFDIIAEQPEPASVIILEMYERNGINVIEMYYKRSSVCDRVDRIAFSNCAQPCSLDALRMSVQKYIPKDWYAECHTSNGISWISVISWTLFGAGLIISICLLKKCICERKEEMKPLLA